jgi:hypothetical protein
VSYFLKTERGVHAPEIDMSEGEAILDRGRHEGRRVVEVFVLHPDGHIDRYEERTRRKLGSNAISSRTWLCQSYHPDESDAWGDDRYIPNPEEEIQATDPAPEAVVLVLTGAEGDSQNVVEQMTSLRSRS